MYTKKIDLVILLLGAITLLGGCSKMAREEKAPISYLNGTWMKAPEAPVSYVIRSLSWGKAKTLGESSLVVDLGDNTLGGVGWIFFPGGGIWQVADFSPIDESTVKISLKNIDAGPSSEKIVVDMFHFLDSNRFWIETLSRNTYPSGPDEIMYRLSGPGDPIPPSSLPRTGQE